MNRHERRQQERMTKDDPYGGHGGGRHSGSKKGFHAGCFGKSYANRTGYKPRRFKKDFSVDRRYV